LLRFTGCRFENTNETKKITKKQLFSLFLVLVEMACVLYLTSTAQRRMQTASPLGQVFGQYHANG
jgi:hypothetical protein